MTPSVHFLDVRIVRSIAHLPDHRFDQPLIGTGEDIAERDPLLHCVSADALTYAMTMRASPIASQPYGLIGNGALRMTSAFVLYRPV